MFDELLKLVGNNSQEAIVNNNAIPNEHNEAVTQEVANSIQSGLAEHASNGGLESLMQMFSGQAGNVGDHPAVQSMITNAATNIASKFGIDPAQATSMASSLIPQVMNQFTQKTADPNDKSFDLQSVMGSLTGGGGAAGGIGGLISKFL